MTAPITGDYIKAGAPIQCPRCGARFNHPNSMGGHVAKCGVTREELFWSKVKKGPECWEWQNGLTSSGYGCAYIKGKKYVASRLAWIYTYGAIPKGQLVLHKCDNPRCVKPEHLYLGNDKDNTNDRRIRGRMCSKLTDDDVRAIRLLLGKKLQTEIGAMFNISPSVISSIKHGKRWRHVA